MSIRLLPLAAAVAVGAIALPAAAQNFSQGYTFLKAVREADANKAIEILNRPGSGAVVVDTRDAATGEGAIHIAARRRDIAWVNFVAQKGGRVDLRDNQGVTALFIAAQLGWTDGVQVLLARKAGVDIATNAGETPLMRAVQNRDLSTVRVLMQAGANPDKRDLGAGLSARDLAKRDPRASLILREIEGAKPVKRATVGPN